MITVKATREGLIGHLTSTGWRIDNKTLFVALPHTKARHRRVTLLNPANGRSCEATVLDTGPFNIDDPYVFQACTNCLADSSAPEIRPLAEQGIKTDGVHRIHGTTNGAGIDLGEAVWHLLGMTDNGPVQWQFLN